MMRREILKALKAKSKGEFVFSKATGCHIKRGGIQLLSMPASMLN
jgi:hypothetical protein